MYHHNIKNTWTKEITIGKHILDLYRMAEVKSGTFWNTKELSAMHVSVRIHALKYVEILLIIALHKSSIFHY